MRKALSLLCFTALAACSGGAGGLTGSQTRVLPSSQTEAVDRAAAATLSTAAGIVWNVGAGASMDSFAVQDLLFLPRSITVNAGDSIVYHVGSGFGGDAHTIAFYPPSIPLPSQDDPSDLSAYGGTTVDGVHKLNSGILLGGQTFTLHFPVAGTFAIVCLFHRPAMASTVVVQKAGSAYPHTAQFYLDQGENEEWTDFSAGQLSPAAFPFPNGGTSIAAGIDPGLVHFPPSEATVLRFITSNSTSNDVIAREGSKTIKAGTVLTFVNETSNEPHTVTVATSSTADLPNIPPDPAVNASRTPGVINVFDGTKIVNSGTLGPGGSFKLKFTKPGTYHYGCLYHDNSRMEGWITVTT